MVRSLNAILMKTFANKISESQLIYKSQLSDSALRAWPLKKTLCKIYLYEDKPCSDIDKIICSTLYYHGGKLAADDLATILGFNVKDNDESDPKRYKDDAEICIFNKLLEPLIEDELISKENNKIVLTSLGDFSVREGKKRLFYEAECRYFENFSLINNDEAPFPFRDELSVTTTINNKKKISYYKYLQSDDVDPQIKEDDKALVDSLLEQMPLNTFVFSASLVCNNFQIESEGIDVSIYNENGEDFAVVFFKDGSVSEYVSRLLNNDVNSKIKNIKVEWGYYLKLLHDPEASLDYNSLKPFEDIIEWGKIVKDGRYCWNDHDLFDMLSNNIDANIWQDISSICPIEDIKIYVMISSENWDWNILSARIDGSFIVENSSNYPWNFDVVVHNTNVTKEDIEKLLVDPNLTSVQWLWKEIMPLLSNNFIIKHIDNVSFDLSILTESEPNLVKSLILQYPDKAWNWEYISLKYDLDYILSNINLLSKRLNMRTLTIRALSSEEFAHQYCQSQSFKDELKNNIETSLSSFNVNSSNLIWSNEIIDMLEEIGVLSWCVPIIGGFESNPYIIWDNEFFKKYSVKITSATGYSCVTSRITDFEIVNEHSEFPWDWKLISSKSNWIGVTDFVAKHIAQLDLKIAFSLLSSDTFCSLFECPEMQDFLSSHPDIKHRATELATIQLVKNHIDFDWDWNLLTVKTIDSLKIDKLGDERWVNKWDWHYLSENLAIDNISEYLFQYQDYWNWTILTRRLNKNTILANLADFADKWDWVSLVDSIFTKEDLSINGYLPTIATIISIQDEKSKTVLWEKITRRFTLDELYSQIHQTIILADYSLLFQWDLKYVYDHKDFYLNEYINQYPDDVNWELLSKSKSVERLFFYDKSILSFKMWLEMVKSLLHNNDYDWDFYALSQNDAINWHPAILKIRKKQWDWQYLSQKSKCFSSTSTTFDQFKLSNNIRMFKDVIDFSLLSGRSDIVFDDNLLNSFINEEWDWKAISESNKLAVSNTFLIKNQDKQWDWESLSKSKCLTINKELLENTKQRAWDWIRLSSNNSLQLSLKELLSLDIANWDWAALSGREDIPFDNESILSTLDKSYTTWDWGALSTRTDLQYNEDFILKIWQKPMDWISVSRMSSFIPSINVLSKISNFDLDWDAISQNNFLSKEVLYQYRDKLNWKYVSQSETFQKLGIEFFRKYRTYLDWSIISNSTYFSLSIENLSEFKDSVDWGIINQRKDLNYSNILLDNFADYINWSEASKANTIDFSIDFVKKHIDRWDWSALFNNPLIIEDADKYKSTFKDKLNGIKFIERFPDSNPKVYHFAHLFNAVSIIKTRKILSRIRGKGLFENSAGSNVHRRDTAHHYARFYYRPQTPTQYYNEALGEDSHSSRERWVFGGYDYRGRKIWNSYLECPTTKYWRAQRLGSPKCPMPVFFEFDLREILNHCLNKCYYSTGNMQGDNSQVISIADNPNRLNTSHLYSTIEDDLDTYKAYSQQEFLVGNELDFSCLKNFKIICYNDEQAKLLKMQLGDDPICNHITTDTWTSSGISIFHRTNRTISIDEANETLCFSTDYRDPSSIVIECGNIDGLEIVDKSHIINISNGKIQAYPSISIIKPSIPITVRFMDLQKYDNNSWVIYSNEKNISGSVTSYSIITDKLVRQFEIETSQLHITLTKSLFKSHMINSYHGIGHTVRVMWNAFLIASIDKTVSNSMLPSVLYASLIHDLGKNSDTEGEIHGENSAILYKSKIEQLCSQEDAMFILEAVKYHSIDDSKTPSAVQRNKIWEILKDADALDRSRLPGRGCNPAFLRNKLFSSKDGKEILLIAKELPSLSCDCPWEYPFVDIVYVLKQFVNNKNKDCCPTIDINHLDEVWRLILMENILLSRLLNKEERINMLYGYAETLGDTLSHKLNIEKTTTDSMSKKLNDLEIAYIALDKYVKSNPLTDDSFIKGLEELEILYIEKDVNNLNPLSLCKNLKFLILDGYWIDKYHFSDFSPLKDLGEIYIWHNSGDTHIRYKLNSYTNIDNFSNINYSENSDDPWGDYYDKIRLYSNNK